MQTSNCETVNERFEKLRNSKLKKKKKKNMLVTRDAPRREETV